MSLLMLSSRKTLDTDIGVLLENIAEITDEDLLEQTRNQSSFALEELMRRYEKQIYNLGLRIARSPEDALEIVQNTFISVFKGIDDFRQESTFKTWIYRVATNAALMLLRKKKRNREVPVEDGDWSTIELKTANYPRWKSDPAFITENKELAEFIREAIGKLPDIYRTAFILRDIEGLSNAQTASILDISLSALKSRILRARIQMREALSNYIEEGSNDK